MDELKRLQSVRAGHKAYVSKITGNFEDCKQHAQERIRQLRDKKEKISALTEEITKLLLTENDIVQEMTKQNEYVDSIDELISKLSPPPSQITSTNPCNVQVKLPKIKIEKFNGQVADWNRFWQSFDSAINSNSGLNNIDKFNYLHSLLDGSAQKCITGLPLTAANYDKAVKLLQDRFSDNQRVINEHMDRLFNVRPVHTMDTHVLRSFLDYVNVQLRSLEGAGIQSNSFDSLLLPLLLSKLPSEIKLRLARKQDNQQWTLKDLLEILEKEVKSREKCDLRSKPTYQKWTSPSAGHNFNSSSGRLTTMLSSTNADLICPFCSNRHLPTQCKVYDTVVKRKNKLQHLHLCCRCLRGSHSPSSCKHICKYCKGPHHIAICDSPYCKVNNPDNSKPNIQKAANSSATHSMANMTENQSNIILQTAKARIFSNAGAPREVNLLFDKGSQRSYIIQELCDDLRLPQEQPHTIYVNTFSHDHFKKQQCRLTHFTLGTLSGSVSLSALSIDMICNSLNQSCNPEANQNLHGLDVHNSFVQGPIHILIGCDWYWDLVNGKIVNHHKGLVAMDSQFGWLVSGRSIEASSLEIDPTFSSFMAVSHCEEIIQAEVIQEELKDAEEMNVEEIEEYKKNIKFNNNQYTVNFPWRKGFHLNNSNQNLAETRLLSLLRSLKSQNLMEPYNRIIYDYLEKDYIEEVEESHYSTGCHYIPHHLVKRLDKETTKLRIVFDGSAKLKGAISLNECLYKGPPLIADLLGMLFHFQSGPIVVLADIQEAFLQVVVSPVERDYLRFLWVDLDTGKLKHFRFKRLPFGLSCSPFLLNLTVKEHLEKHSVPRAAQFYVDDLVISCQNSEEGKQLALMMKKVMADGGFNLRKWKTNNSSLQQHELFNGQHDDESETYSVLGVKWKIMEDAIAVDVTNLNQDQSSSITKRHVLSVLAKIFDPLGYISCVTIVLRIFFQTLHRLGVDWDQSLPESYAKEFERIISSLNRLQTFSIPRLMSTDLPSHELHVFSDASQKAYGACLFLRGFDEHQFYMRLVRSKAKVAPSKQQSIPRLELMAAVISSHLVQHFQSAMPKFQRIPVFCWTDSMAALTWIRGTKQWPCYIENRVKLIREANLDRNFHYIESEKNPADQLSRGMTRVSVDILEKWVNGPDFLRKPGECQTGRLEATKVFLSQNDDGSMEPLINLQRFSNLQRACAVFVKVKKAVNLMQRKCVSEYGTTSFEEAKKYFIRETQEEYFADEINHLKSGKRNPLIRKLDLVWNDGLVKVQTRLANANLCPTAVAPILLPYSSPLTALIIRDYHTSFLHCGVRETLTNLRVRYWVIKGRKAIKRIIKSCVTCRKIDGHPYKTPEQPPLPWFRVESQFPFSHIGIDYAGPLSVKVNLTTRSKATCKAYIVLFVCATTRALHMEMVLDLTAESFILAFRRFIARRGIPSFIISDNGKTFISASKALATKINDSCNTPRIKSFLSSLDIEWQFIVPRSPWWGGFYERMVQIVKRCLKRVVFNALLSYLQLETTLIEIESLVNNRPLTYIHNEPGEPECITPNHLILGRNCLQRSSKASTSENANDVIQLSKHQQNIHLQFLKIFKREYLTGLREQFTMPNKPGESPTIGDIVHVHQDKPRTSWKMGRITELLRGRDGKVRAAKVRMPHCGQNHEILTRSIHHLYPLETSRKTEELSKKSVASNFNINSASLLAITFMVIMSLTAVVSGSSNSTAVCTKLKCMNQSHGTLQHYNIYSQLEWITVNVYVCSREYTKCEFWKGVFGGKSHTCITSFEKITRASCLEMGRTKQSVDGVLEKQTPHLYSTNNQIHTQYAWLSTRTDVKWNSMVELHQARTNGTHVVSTLESLEPCHYRKGECALMNKTMVWDPICFYNLEFVSSEICHHDKSEVYCAESDFDVKGMKVVCGLQYISTRQGNLLSVNSTKEKWAKHKRLNAAVIQYLEDRIETLSKLVLCLAQNQYCQRLNETVVMQHQVFTKFQIDKQFLDVDESSISDVIRNKLIEIMNEEPTILQSGNTYSSIAAWFMKVENIIITAISSLVLLGAAYCLIPTLYSCLKGRCTNTTQNDATISSPIALHSISQTRLPHRYHTISSSH